METSKVSSSIRISADKLLCCLIVVCSLCVPASNAETDGVGQSSGRFSGLRSEDVRVRQEVLSRFREDRQRDIDELVALLDPKNANSESTRMDAAYFLEQMRAEEAVPMLIECLAEIDDSAGVMFETADFGTTVYDALFEIGRPAIPALIEVIETSDNRLRRKSSLDLLCLLLEGKRPLLELLESLQAKAEAADRARRIADARAHVERAIFDDPEKDSAPTVGLALVKMIPPSLITTRDAEGRVFSVEAINTDAKGLASVDFEVLRWLRMPWSPEWQRTPEKERPKLNTATMTFSPQGSQPWGMDVEGELATLKDVVVLMEVRIANNKLIAQECWKLPEFVEAERK